MTEKSPKTAKESPIYSLVRASRCYNCDEKQVPGSLVRFQSANDESEVICRKCSNLSDLEFLKSGNTKVTQLAKKHSKRVVVVMQWSELWKAYERKGLLVESEAIDKTEKDLGFELKDREGKQA